MEEGLCRECHFTAALRNKLGCDKGRRGGSDEGEKECWGSYTGSMCDRELGGHYCVGGHSYWLSERMPYATCRHVKLNKRESRTGVRGEWLPSAFTFSTKILNVKIESDMEQEERLKILGLGKVSYWG